MCIILHKPANTELPDISTLETCFQNKQFSRGRIYVSARQPGTYSKRFYDV